MKDTLIWRGSALDILRGACTPHGIRASWQDHANYAAVFARDAVMSGIAGWLVGDAAIVEGFVRTLEHLKKWQGPQGQIPSNFEYLDDGTIKVSFGTLSPKIDAATWYMIGVGLLTRDRILDKQAYQESIIQVVDLLQGIEYNGRHLMTIPMGGNWADEYIYDGYILYDQVLRAWGLKLLGEVYCQEEWILKSQAILECIAKAYRDEEIPYYCASFTPGGRFRYFDLAAHSLLFIVRPLAKSKDDFNPLLWMASQFLDQGSMPGAFYPIITEEDSDWHRLRTYHLYDFRNKPHHYHNGGIWYIWLGWLSVALSLQGLDDDLQKLLDLSFSFLESQSDFQFDEYIIADEMRPAGTQHLCYTATGIVLLSLASEGFDFSRLK